MIDGCDIKNKHLTKIGQIKTKPFLAPPFTVIGLSNLSNAIIRGLAFSGHVSTQKLYDIHDDVVVFYSEEHELFSRCTHSKCYTKIVILRNKVLAISHKD